MQYFEYENQTLTPMRTPLFYLSAALLCCNDFVWKSQFHNALTGKLSDFAGIALWVLFWEAWLPQRFRAHLYITSALFFVWFKSPLSEFFLQFLHLGRVVDYTDLWALLVLLPLYYYNKNTSFVTWQPTVAGSVFALFLFGATSIDNPNEYENLFACEPYNFGVSHSDDTIKQRIRTQFPTQSNIYESQTTDTSNVSIAFRCEACTKGVSVTFHLYAHSADSCRITMSSIATICKGVSVDKTALCRQIQDSIFNKIR